MIGSISRKLKYLVDKQGYLIDKDNCSDMKVQNPVLFVIIFEVKINNVSFSILRLGKKISLQMNYGSPLLLLLEIRKFRVILI